MAVDSLSRNPDFEDLARRLSNLEDQAYQEFADYFGTALLRFLLQQGLDETEAEDLAATCITDAAMKVRTKYQAREDGSFQAWVYQIARRKAFDWHRKRKRQSEVIVALPSMADSSEDPEGFNENLAASLAVQAALGQLSDLDREILECRILYGNQTFEEIAVDLHIGVDTARQRFHRASKRIADILSRDHRLQKYERKGRKSA